MFFLRITCKSNKQGKIIIDPRDTMKKIKSCQISTWTLGSQEAIRELVVGITNYLVNPFAVALSTPGQGDQSIVLNATEKMKEQKKFLENLKKKFVQQPTIDGEDNNENEQKRVEDQSALEEEYLTDPDLTEEEIRFIHKASRLSIKLFDDKEARILSGKDEEKPVLVLIQSLFGEHEPDQRQVLLLVCFDINRGFEDVEMAPERAATGVCESDKRAMFVCKKHGGLCTHYCKTCKILGCGKCLVTRRGEKDSCLGHELMDLESFQTEMESKVQGCVSQVVVFDKECGAVVESLVKEYHELLGKKESNEKRQQILLELCKRMQNILKMDQSQPTYIENEDKLLTVLLNSCFVPQNNSQFIPANTNSQLNEAPKIAPVFYEKLARMIRIEEEFNKSFAEHKNYETNPKDILIKDLQKEIKQLEAEMQERIKEISEFRKRLSQLSEEKKLQKQTIREQSSIIERISKDIDDNNQRIEELTKEKEELAIFKEEVTEQQVEKQISKEEFWYQKGNNPMKKSLKRKTKIIQNTKSQFY